MPLTQFSVDEGPHNSDGMLLHGRDETAQVTAFISRRVMDDWVIRDSLTGGEKVSFASNITHSAHTICRQSRALLPPNMIGAQPSIVSHYGQWRSGRCKRLGARRAL